MRSSDHVIVNQSVSQDITQNELRSIFSMRRRTWKDGSAIRVFVLPDAHPIHHRFCKNVLDILPYRLRNKWNRLVFTGTGQTPIEVRDESDMRERVSVTPGAIGYLSQRVADKGVNPIFIDSTHNE